MMQLGRRQVLQRNRTARWAGVGVTFIRIYGIIMLIFVVRFILSKSKTIANEWIIDKSYRAYKLRPWIKRVNRLQSNNKDYSKTNN